MLYRQLKMDYQAPPEAQAVWDKTGRLNPEDWLAAQDDHAAVLKKIAERR
jgi:hypothetical protein